jgi:hypothetical protein
MTTKFLLYIVLGTALYAISPNDILNHDRAQVKLDHSLQNEKQGTSHARA